MKWIRERDALIAQTLAFVQSVTGRKDEFRRTDGAGPVPVETMKVTALLAVAPAAGFQLPDLGEPAQAPPPPPEPRPITPPRPAADFRQEVQARVASFRKYQERFEREREEYCAATLAKLRAAIRDGASGPTAGT